MFFMFIKYILLSCFVLITTNTMAQQTDQSLVPYRQGDKWGYSSPDRKVIISPKYDEANWFSEGLASVKMGSKYGYINKTGKLVIPAKFTVAKSFRNGYLPNPKKEGGDSVLFAGASLLASGEEICIDTKGVRMRPCPAISENAVLENLVPVKTVVIDKNYSVPNNNGLFDKIVDDYKIEGAVETYYIAVKNNLYGVFNSKFDTIVPFLYNSIKINRKTTTPFLHVNKGGMYGVILLDGKIAIAPEYTNLVTIDGQDKKEYVIIQKGGKTFVKDITNRDIISTGYSDIIYNDGGFIIVSDNNLSGYYFIDNTVIQPRYKEIKRINGTSYLIIKTAAGKVGYINSAGDEYFVE